jgi:hypothetical protein
MSSHTGLKLELQEQEAAAVKIQAVVRGQKVRKGKQQQSTRTSEYVELGDGTVATGMYDSPEEEAAALKIQALQRGRAARRRVEKMREDGADIKNRILQQVGWWIVIG